VEVSGGNDDVRAALRHTLHPIAPGAGNLDAGLDGLGAGVHRQHHVFAREGGESCDERAETVVVERAAREGDPPELGAGRLDERGVPVPEVHGGVRGEAVEVALARDIHHPCPVTVTDDNLERVVVVCGVLVLVAQVVGGDALRSRFGGCHWRGCRHRRSSRVQHLTPPPPSSSSERSTPMGL
jgi:hypothetical protein